MRELVCNDCGDTVEVYEEPREFVDPARYRCGLCLKPDANPQLKILELNPRREMLRYNPAQAQIPF